jgi:putative ABC transport system permease protein
MGLSESIRSSIAEILGHKLRSILTLAGIVLGTTALVVMVSVIGGAAKAVEKGLTDLGFDGVMFVSGQPATERLERKKQGYSRGLRTSDLQTIEAGKELIREAAPLVSLKSETARINGQTLNVDVDGITQAWASIRNREVEAGRFLVEQDVVAVSPVAVVGAQLRDDVFGQNEAVGREILIRGVRFRIVGVQRSLGTNQVNDPDMRRDNRKVYVPITAAQKYFTGETTVHAYAFRVADTEQITAAEGEAEALLRRSHRGISDFKVENIGEEMLRIRKEVDQLIANWQVVLASIAGISLLVGGIGIFSVMQISISERVYEIGLRKSIGATDGAIFGQFLVEAMSLSLVGGLFGSALGYGITLLASQAFEDGLAVSPLGLLLAAGFALVIGLAAGLWPALRASRLTPVDAIRAL